MTDTDTCNRASCSDNRAWLAKTLNEVRALQRLHHPNIVQYQHAWLESHQSADFGPTLPCLFILMEYANGGSLLDLISARHGAHSHLDEDTEIWPYLIDILLGLRHLHNQGVIHRVRAVVLRISTAFPLLNQHSFTPHRISSARIYCYTLTAPTSARRRPVMRTTRSATKVRRQVPPVAVSACSLPSAFRP